MAANGPKEDVGGASSSDASTSKELNESTSKTGKFV